MSNLEGTDRFSDDSLTGRGPDLATDFSVVTLEDEATAGGWTPITKPVGVDALDGTSHEPERTITAGMRGEPDMDDDEGSPPYMVG